MADLEVLSRRLDEVERSQSELKSKLEETEEARDAYHTLYLETMERCRKLERGLLGKSSERFAENPAQLSLDVMGLAIAERDKAAIEALPPDTVKSHERRRPPGRNAIPDHVPRVDIEIIPDEVQREGLNAFERIGEEVTEVLERRPASLVVARVVKPKFVRRTRNKQETIVLVGTTPGLPIPRGVAGPGLLADTIVRRWQDHLPLHRLEGIYKRDGMQLARSTMCSWHEKLADLAKPVIAAMRADAFKAPYLCTDATGVLVQAKEQCRRGHFWVLIAPGQHVLFEYTPRHTAEAVDSILAGYEGVLVADAHTVYDHLYKDGTLIEANCWAHARRYFFKALSSDPDRAKRALESIGLLFKIERSIATAPRKKREAIRDKHSAPVVERFFSWCDAEWPSLLEDTPVHDGVRYARNQRVGLQRFLEDGRLPIHNNDSERELRRQAVGRKNWLFVGSDDGARVNATFTSLLASCHMHNLEPWGYLRDLFCLLPTWPAHRMLEIAPAAWLKTAATDEVRTTLAADPFRVLTLDRG